MLKNILKLYCIWTWDTLLCFGFFLFFFFSFFSFWWDNERTTSETPSPGLEAEGLTQKLLRLKHYCIWPWRFFFIFILFFFPLCLSNACLAYCWLIHYFSQFTSLTHFVFLCFVFLLVCLFVFSFCFIFFAFPLLSPFHSKTHHCYYYKLENTKLHTVQGQ
jgi:hypothetical protein